MTGDVSKQPQEPPAAETTSRPESAATGSGYRASVTGEARPMWTCDHLHFTEHSALACANAYVRALRRPAVNARSTGVSPARNRPAEGHLKPGVAAGGGAYRAIVIDATRRPWSCVHVHFTEHSARACAERHLRT